MPKTILKIAYEFGGV